MKYDAVIFDLFGTLVDNFTKSEYTGVLKEMAAVLDVDAEEFIRGWQESFDVRANGTHRTLIESIRYICDQTGASPTEDQVQQAADVRLAFTRKALVSRPATIPTIRELKAKGLKVGLISDCSPETPRIWPETALDGLFDITVFSCSVSLKKPDPRIYLYACEKLGVKPEDCLYVGDGSSNELTGAANVGMHSVLIRDPNVTDDTHFIDRDESWHGDAISTLDEVLGMVE